ncbi:2-oxoacid:acceptor oxidoreductase subunit alpha [Pelolinea submarina]|uniref:2-oxoglutarate ferredoxin oxidoreductase subunit alpha n=1 Tax=Pelolinea submarina TaxID=913107 RepID=A0A347ZTF4_9CHLR|nr:2-oxoacid:acceptor oxidoreductase subunit alpha [Pelolinea submarina]REG10839.1 2-oxoglutarate ferredoxin oxidoreductase subunit alpha [Pelolinea submarina]BBB48585.1 2-oxoglutarate/2-oxoacid ferredoxin oxidoreductase subunit alpha [Pelolinea submarina]
MKINEFGIAFSTINGSGSATANNTIQRAIFKMGIPVSARNIFPSNIQGMPTWYHLRVSQKEYYGRLEKEDILIAMNPETVAEDIKKLNPNGILLINSSISPPGSRNDISIVKMPVNEILEACASPSNLGIYLANMVYVGILSFLIGIDLDQVEKALEYHFNHRRSAVDPNFNVVKQAFQWAQENLNQDYGYKLEALDLNKGRIMIDGNTAGAIGALFGGLQYAAWYPITPATGLAEALNEYIPRLRTDPSTGSSTCVVVQAEDELAAIGMVVGAGWAGLRSMTSTSGPGLCLMAEYLGLAYFAEVPVVIWDVQRVGPSTGLPTHTSQGDLAFSYFISHGDKDFVILLPSDVGECFEFGWKALDIAEKLQTPVLVLSDLELGMNIWSTDRFKYPDKKIDRGKILWEKDLERMAKEGNKVWGRYKDLDGDGIPYRTVPGNLNAGSAYFTRGTGHDDYAHYSEEHQDWENNLLRLKRKVESAKELIPQPLIVKDQKSENGFISYGTSNMPALEAVDKLSEESLPVDYLRIKAIPFTQSVEDFLQNHQNTYVIEANRDGQMKNLLCMNFPQYANRIHSIARCDGLSLSAEWVCNQFKAQAGKGA